MGENRQAQENDSSKRSDSPREPTFFEDVEQLLPLESRGAFLTIAQTDLCPAVVVRSRLERLKLFAGLDRWGLSSPRHLAAPTQSGIKILSRGKKEEVAGDRLGEPWLFCWFAGGRGWDDLRYGQPCHWRGRHPEDPFPHVDVPWLIVLQRRPERVRLGIDGVELAFPSDPGTIVLMPLFGLDFQPAGKTLLWENAPPPEVIERCRRWAARLRFIPIACRERFSADFKRDEVAVEQVFDYLKIEDEWETRGEITAPYPPFVTLAERCGSPVEIEGVASESEIATLYGPYGFRTGATRASYRLKGLLRYIAEEETYPQAPASPAARRACERLRRLLAHDPRIATRTSGGYSRGLALAIASYRYAMPYLEKSQRDEIKKIIAESAREILDPSRYQPFFRYPTAKEEEPVGEAQCLRARDAYKVVQANLFGIWAAADATGDPAAAAEAWPLARRFFHLPYQTQWLTALPSRWEGLDIARALFDGTIGYARLAALVGQAEEFLFASYLFAKVCAGWFAMESIPRYHEAHRPWIFNTDADYLVWHPCRINGYVLIANDHLLTNERPEVDGRGWASAYGRLTPSSARIWRDFLRPRADETLNEMLRRCRRDWAEAGAPAVVRSYVFGETAEQLESYRPADETAERNAASHPIRRRTYRLFQSTPLLKEVAIAEAASKPSPRPVLPETPQAEASLPGADRTASRFEQNALPVRIESPKETGRWPLLFWPGIKTPKRPFAVLDERLDLLPFGVICGESGDDSQETQPGPVEIHHPNWCLSIFAHHDKPIESPAVERTPEGGFRVRWTTPEPADSILEIRPDDLEKTSHGVETIRDNRQVCDHSLLVPPAPRGEILFCRALSFDRTGRAYRSEAVPLPTGRVNWAFGRPVFVTGRFPAKQYKYAWDKEKWLEEYRNSPPKWNRFDPPNELTDGRGLRPGVEPFIRRAEADPAYRHWIAIDLGAARPIDEVRIAFDPAWVSAGYRLETGPPDAPWCEDMAPAESPLWRDIICEIGDNTQPVRRHGFPLRQTRWIRVLFTHPAPVGRCENRIALWEIEVIGPNDADLK